MRILILTIAVAAVFCASQAKATVFFDEGFENGLVASGWTTGSCGWISGTGSFNSADYPDGCNPTRSTDVVHSGTHSLKGTYLTSPCPGGDQTGSCGAWIDRQHPSTTDIYTRFWYYTVGFAYNSAGGGTKHFYHRSNAAAGPENFWVHPWGSREWQANVTSVAGGGANGIQNNPVYYAPNLATVPLNDRQWYCIETRYKLNTPGVANGEIDVWVNGTQTMSITGAYTNFRSTDPNNTNSSPLFTNDYVRLYTQLGYGTMYYDDFAVGDTRIGCSGTAPAALTGDTTPPAPPIGLVIR